MIPVRTHEQQIVGLMRANEVRKARAECKRLIRYNPQNLATMIDNMAAFPEFSTWKLWDALRALDGVGSRRAQRMLRECRISEAKTLGGLTERQRDEIVSLLKRHAEHRYW